MSIGFACMSHSFCQVLVHVVWAVKAREPLLQKGIREELYVHIALKCKEEGVFLISLGGVEDHVHCLFQLPRNRSLAETVQFIKGDSSSWLNTDGGMAGNFQWQRGYSAFSVSPQRVAQIKQYILQQEQHHRSISFEEELKKFSPQVL